MSLVKRSVSIFTFGCVLVLSGCNSSSSDGDSGSGNGGDEILDDLPVQPLQVLSDAEVSFEKFFYANGEFANVTMTFTEKSPDLQTINVALVAPSSGDIESLSLSRTSTLVYSSVSGTPINVLSPGSPASVNDGQLSLLPGEVFHAIYFVNRSVAGMQNLAADMYTDFGFVERPSITADRVIDAVALTDDEDSVNGRSVGTLLRRGELPVQIATEEVIFWAQNENDIQNFLVRVSGELISSRALDPSDSGASYQSINLVALTPPANAAERLPVLDEFVGETDQLIGSSEAVLSITGFVMQMRMEGLAVAVNPRLQYQGEPVISSAEESALTHTMKNIGPSNNCLPNDPLNPCVENIPATWSYMTLAGATNERINIGVLDMGFATNADFRLPESGTIRECDMTASPANCSPGAAQGSPTVGNSFFGDRSWHGTGVIHTLGGVVNNGQFAAGSGGQVVVPMLYKYDTESYVFDIGAGIDQAVADGASCINISGGYPCRLLTSVGPDFNICTESGRFGICAVVNVSLFSSAAAVCSVGPLFPIFGDIACGLANAGAIAATATCTATLAFGNLASPMFRAVDDASDAGVPVVTIAGNVLNPDKLPPLVRDLVNTDNIRTEDWGIMPAMAPAAIVVGAVDSGFQNVHFIGDRVDIWAPIGSAYFGPQNVNDPTSTIVAQRIGGTSAASPFVAGVVANMQAVNRNLNPQTIGLTEVQRSNIVSTIKSLLTDPVNSFSNEELVALGFASDPDRRVMIDPLKAVIAAEQMNDRTALPVLGERGFDATLGYSEQTGNDDVLARAQTLTTGAELTGTILAIPDATGEITAPDEDWISFVMPEGTRVQEFEVTITQWSSLAGGVSVVESSRPTLDVFSQTKRFLGEPGERINFALGGGPNAYKVTGLAVGNAIPSVEILSPSNEANMCATGVNASVTLSANAFYPDALSDAVYGDLVVNDADISWSDIMGGTFFALGTGRELTVDLAIGTHRIQAQLFNDETLSAEIRLNVVECVEFPPSASITTPSMNLIDSRSVIFTGFDSVRGQSYADINVSALVSDIEDGSIPAGSIVWKTDLTAVQDAILGTGPTRIIRLYSIGDGQTVTHQIRVEATDSDGNVGVSATRQITLFVFL